MLTMEGTAFWLVPHGFSLWFLTEHRTKAGPTHNGLAHLPSITNLKNALQACLQPCLMKHFVDRGSLISDDSSLCQDDIKLGSTQGFGKVLPRDPGEQEPLQP